MRRLPVARIPITIMRQRLLASLAIVAVVLGTFTLAQPASATATAAVKAAAAASACAYDLCGVTFTTKSGQEYLSARPAPRRGMLAVSNADAAVLGAQKALSFQDVGDGTVYIRDFWGRCLASSGDDVVQFQACELAPNERWYFQGQGQPGLFAIRLFANSNGDHDNRCLDVNNGHPGPTSRMKLHRCKNSNADWQMFVGSNVDSAKAQSTRAGIYDRASRYASTQCEKKENITCSYTPGATAKPALTAPEMLAATAFNYQSTPVKDTISVKTSKSATVTWGFSQKLTVKVEAGVLGFEKEEWDLENAWSFNKATTDLQELNQSLEVMVPVNAVAWVSYAQLTTEVKGNIRFVVGDTGRGWTGESTVTLPTKNDGKNASVMVVCDSLSTKSYCVKTRPTHTVRATTVAPRATGVEWLVTAEGDDHACSGAAIDERWVLTAKHCIEATQVRFPGADGAGADVVAVDRIIDSPESDVRLLHLAQPHALSAYPSLDLGYQPHDGDVSTAFTVGTPDDPRPVSRTSTVQGERDGDMIAVRTDDMPDLALDSGGPLVVGGKIVGIASVADASSPIMTFANLRGAASIIAPEVIDSVVVQDGGVAVTMGKNLFESPTRVMIWADDAYVAETYAGTPYYGWRRDNGDGTVTVFASVPAGALIRVGTADGQPGWGARVDELRVHDAVLDGANPRATLKDTRRFRVDLSDEAVASDRRLMIFVNGTYAGETWKGTAYTLLPHSAWGETALISTSDFSHGDVLEVRAAEGEPGWSADRYAVLLHTVL